MKQNESQEQRALFGWADIMVATGKYPELKLLFHIPNGGYRSKTTAARLKREGVKAGVPDLFLPVPRGTFHGLWIELKAGNNQATDLQREWLNNLDDQGYYAACCNGWIRAHELIEWYLNL